MYNEPQSPLRILILPSLVLFWIALGVGLFRLNPHLFSKTTLMSQIIQSKVSKTTPFPSKNNQRPLSSENLNSTSTSFTQDSQIAPEKLRWSRKLVQKDKTLVTHPFGDAEPQWLLVGEQMFLWTPEASRFYSQKFGGKSPQWSFQFSSDTEHLIDRPELSQELLFGASNQNLIFALDRVSGRLRWSLPLKEKVQYSPILMENVLFTPVLNENGESYFIKIDGISGQILGESLSAPGKLTARPKVNTLTRVIYLGTDKPSLFALNSKDNQWLWTYNLNSPISAPPAFSETHVFAHTQDGIAFSVNLNTGAKGWEYRLKGPSATSFVFVPGSPFMAILTDNGYLHTLNFKTGQGVWRFKTQSQAKTKNLMAIRLNNQVIEERELKWKYKGWVLWSPCVQNRICMFNPEEGNLIGRLSTKGQIASMPIFDQSTKMFYLALKRAKDELTDKIHDWSFGHFIDRSQYIRELKKAASQAKAARANKEIKAQAKPEAATPTPKPKPSASSQDSAEESPKN